jgi:hypothetical protein
MARIGRLKRLFRAKLTLWSDRISATENPIALPPLVTKADPPAIAKGSPGFFGILLIRRHRFERLP